MSQLFSQNTIYQLQDEFSQNILISQKLTNYIKRIQNISIFAVSFQFFRTRLQKWLVVSDYRILCNLFNKLMSMQRKDQLSQTTQTELHVDFQPSYNQGVETVYYESLSETDKKFVQILANLSGSIENTNIESLINETAFFIKQLFSLHSKKSSQIDELQQKLKNQKQCVEKLSIRVEQYEVANDQLKAINQKNQTIYQADMKKFQDLKNSWENSKKELEQAQRKNKEQSQKIRLLNKDMEIQKEVILSLEKKINYMENQISDLSKSNKELQRDKQWLEKQLQILNDELNHLKHQTIQQVSKLGEENLENNYNGCYSVREDTQSVYSVVSVNKKRDNIDVLKQAEKMNQLDKLSRKSSMDVDNQDYDLQIKFDKKSSNISIPQFSQRQMEQSKKIKSGHQRVGSGFEYIKKKNNINSLNEKTKIKSIQSNIVKKNPPKESEQQKQRRILKEIVMKKEIQLQQMSNMFEQFKKESKIKYDLKCRDYTLLQGQFQLEIQELKAKADHEKSVSLKFMQENIDWKSKYSKLMEVAKNLYAERDYAEKYYSQYLQEKCKQFIKEKSNFLEQRMEQIKVSLSMLMQYYKKWINNQLYETQQQKQRRIELENIILKLNGGDIQIIKKVRFRKSKTDKKKNSIKKTQHFDIEDIFKDQPTQDTSKMKCSTLSDEPKLGLVKTQSIVILPRRLSRQLTSNDHNIEILSEMQLSLTLDQDSKLQYKDNIEDSISDNISKKQIQNQKTANQTPNKQMKDDFVQTFQSSFSCENVVKQLFSQKEINPNNVEVQSYSIQTKEFEIQASQILINNDMAQQFSTQTFKQVSQQIIQVQTGKNQVQVQASPLLESTQLQTYALITESKSTQSFLLSNSSNQTQVLTVIQSSLQTCSPNVSQKSIEAKIDYQNQQIQYSIQQKQFGLQMDLHELTTSSTIQTEELIQNKNSGIQSDFQQHQNISVQTIQGLNTLTELGNTPHFSDFSQQTQFFMSKYTQTQLHFQLFDFSLQTQNVGFGKVPLTEEEFLSIQTKTKGSKVDVESIASSENFQQQVEQKQPRKWTFYNPQNTNRNFFQQRKMEKGKSPRLSSKSHKVEKDQSSSLIIDINETDCKELPPERILQKLVPKPIGSIIFVQKNSEINNKFKWNRDKYYMIQAESEKDGTKEKFLVWKKGIFSMISRKYLKLKMKGLCFNDPEMINIGNSQIIIRGQQVLIRKKEKNGCVSGGLENGNWKILNCSLYDSRK